MAKMSLDCMRKVRHMFKMRFWIAQEDYSWSDRFIKNICVVCLFCVILRCCCSIIRLVHNYWTTTAPEFRDSFTNGAFTVEVGDYIVHSALTIGFTDIHIETLTRILATPRFFQSVGLCLTRGTSQKRL